MAVLPDHGQGYVGGGLWAATSDDSRLNQTDGF